MNNTIQGNVNGLKLTFDGPSSLSILNNSFSDSSSVSSAPLIINAGTESFNAIIGNNTITNNVCGGIHCILNDTNLAHVTIKNNMITNNSTGSVGPFGAAIFIDPSSSTLGNCLLEVADNTITDNVGSGLYCANGAFNDFNVNAASNTLLDNGASGFAFANAANTFTLKATNNTIKNGADNGISTSNTITSADITISNNTITGNINYANGINLSHDGVTLNFVSTDNTLSQNQGSAILVYPSVIDVENVTMNVARNTINNNQNLGSNAASGIDIEQFNSLSGALTNNTFENNSGTAVYIGSAGTMPSVCLELSGNVSDVGYTLSTGTGTFDLAPCDVNAVNTGVINTIGVISSVQSCQNPTPCTP